MDTIILVTDVRHHGVICSAKSFTHANAITSGLFNSRIKTYLKRERSHWNYNYNDTSIHYRLPTDSENIQELQILSEKFATKEWEDFRKLVFAKSNSLEYWEFRCKVEVSRNEEYFDNGFYAFIMSQLNLCDSNQQYYTQAIHEYAQIQNLSVETAYEELQMKTEATGMLQMRNYATYLKGVREINKQTTVEDTDRTLKKLLKFNNYLTLKDVI